MTASTALLNHAWVYINFIAPAVPSKKLDCLLSPPLTKQEFIPFSLQQPYQPWYMTAYKALLNRARVYITLIAPVTPTIIHGFLHSPHCHTNTSGKVVTWGCALHRYVVHKVPSKFSVNRIHVSRLHNFQTPFDH